jgi:hypothetical protein
MDEVTIFHQNTTDPNLLQVGDFGERIKLYDLRMPKVCIKESE